MRSHAAWTLGIALGLRNGVDRRSTERVSLVSQGPHLVDEIGARALCHDQVPDPGLQLRGVEVPRLTPGGPGSREALLAHPPPEPATGICVTGDAAGRFALVT